MSLRIDTSEWISGALLIGDTGLGVVGSLIPSTGTDGPGYAYNDLSLPADNAKEICGRITTWPSAGTLFAYEDTSFTFAGAPDGSYTAQYQLYVDGVATGSPATITFTVGATGSVAPGVGSLTITGYAPTVTQTGGVAVNPGAGALALTGYAPSIAQTANQTVAPGPGSLAITGYAPAVTQESASKNILPGFGALTITGYPPTITQSGPAGHGKRRVAVEKYGRIELYEDEKDVPAEIEPVVIQIAPKQAQKAPEMAVASALGLVDLPEPKRTFDPLRPNRRVRRAQLQDDDEEALLVLLL